MFDRIEFLSRLAVENSTKIVLLVIDGIGGLPHPLSGLTEIETAETPVLDYVAREGICGVSVPVFPGITPGSGPAHMSLFGYDPVNNLIGRGVLSAVGIGYDMKTDDVAARANFCTVKNGLVTDRRAGRISNELCEMLCEKIFTVEIDEARFSLIPEKDYRAALIIEGAGLSSEISETDPQKEGVPILTSHPIANTESARRTADLVNRFVDIVTEKLSDRSEANNILLRGFSKLPNIPLMPEIYKMKCASIALYPMYKGVSKLVGMDLLEAGCSFQSEIECLRDNWNNYDFFYVHLKNTDSAGEDGDFERKVELIEEIDGLIRYIIELNPDVLAISGDHSTPSIMKSHSWHPSPVLLRTAFERRDSVTFFSEKECVKGGLGSIYAKDLMPLLLACAGRLDKYGA